MPIEVSVLLDRAGTARKQSYDKKNQERSAYRPQSEDRHRGTEFSASRSRVHAVRYSEATNQWPQPRWPCVSRCDVLDLLGVFIVRTIFAKNIATDPASCAAYILLWVQTV